MLGAWRGCCSSCKDEDKTVVYTKITGGDGDDGAVGGDNAGGGFTRTETEGCTDQLLLNIRYELREDPKVDAHCPADSK